MIMVAILFAVIIGIVQFFSENIVEISGKYYTQVISFSAGISITYVFLDLFPQFSTGVVQKNELLFLTVLFGFIFVHLIEKYAYQHSTDETVDRQLEHINQFISVFYHMVLGIVIFDFVEESLIDALLLIVPILIFTGVSTLPVRSHSSLLVRFFVSLSTFVGVLVAWLLGDFIQTDTQIGLVGFVVGGLLFSVIRHSIPQGKKGKPLFFIIGVAVYTPVILWMVLL